MDPRNEDWAARLPRDFELRGGGSVVLRRAEPADAAALVAYFERVSAESDNLTFGPGEFGVGVEEERGVLADWRRDPRGLYVVALHRGEIVAALTFRGAARPRTWHAGPFGMSVRQDLWGQGIGGALLDTLLAWAPGAGITKIDLTVRTDNAAAIRLYEGRGFEVEGRLRRCMRIRGEDVDCLAMGRCL